jgi:TRAP-type uncharacterized transport system substrate-binding protein
MESAPTPLPTSRIVEPSMRVNALYQMALGLSMNRNVPQRVYSDLCFMLGVVREGTYRPSLKLANGDFDLAYAVEQGDLDVAAINPSAFLSMAFRGTGPYTRALPLRTIAVMPSLDVMLFAVSEETGLTSISDIGEKHYPLKVSVRRSAIHGTRFVVDQVFQANGFSLGDLESWGGRIHYADGPFDENRLDGVRDGSIEAVFDEGVRGWAPLASASGMRFLDLDPASRGKLKEAGWAVVPVQTALPEVKEQIMCPSFSGWPIFTREALSTDIVYLLVQALEEAGDRMVWDTEERVTLADVCTGTDAAPFDVPLHPGAERYYRERGYLK